MVGTLHDLVTCIEKKKVVIHCSISVLRTVSYRTCGCVVNLPHNRTCTYGKRVVGILFGFFFLLIDLSKTEVSDKKNAGFNEERVLSVYTGSTESFSDSDSESETH